jgi:hypothetical protein
MRNFQQVYKMDDAFIRAVSMGTVPGWGYVRKFGSSGVGTTLTTIWSGSEEQPGLYVYPSDAGEILSIYSTSSSDTSGGLGANVIQISGLSENKEDFQEELITMNGTTPVQTTKLYSRVFRAEVIVTGDPLSNTANVGEIHIENLANTILYAHINDGGLSPGQTQMALWTLPTSYSGYYVTSMASANNDKRTSVYLYTRPDTGGVYNTPFRSKAEVKVRNDIFNDSIFVFEPIPGGADFELRGLTETGTDDVAAQFICIYHRGEL